MAAGTETAMDTRGYVNPVGKVIHKVLVARQLAEDEREYAEKKALEEGTTLEELGIKKGHFFKKALKHEFGGEALGEKLDKVKKIVHNVKLAKRIKNNPKAIGALFKRKFIDVKVDRKKSKSFRKLFDYTTDPSNVVPQSKKIPSTAKKIRKATTGRSKRISKEELFNTFNVLIDSLNKTAERIGQNNNEVSAGIMRASVAQADIAEQLKTRNNIIEDKLDRLVDAINNQTQFQKQSIDKAENIQQENKLESIKDTSYTEVPDNTTTQINESQTNQSITPTTSITNIQNISTQSRQRAEMEQMEAYGYPKAERGGIFSGPNTGYLAELHGNEAVIPIDNNYTRGKPSAVDGIRRPKPYETGTRSSSVGGRFGFGITNMTGIAGGGTTANSRMSQTLMDAMTIPMMATGGTILATTTEVMKKMGSAGENISPEIEKISRPIADVFGLPSSITSKAKTGIRKSSTQTDEDSLSKKNIIAMLTDGFGKLLESFGKKVDELPDQQNPPPNGNPDLSPVNLEGFSQEDISNLGKMVYAEAGADPTGSSQVMNSILNRYRQIKQGKATPQSWGVRGGVTSQSMTLTDLLMAENQYQPVSDGRFNKVSSEQATQALNVAIRAGGLNPQTIYERAKQSGLSDTDAKRVAVADSFANDYGMSNNRPFSTPFTRTENGHWFGSSPIGFKPSDLNNLTPVQRTQPQSPIATPTQPTSDWAMNINNYGLPIGEKIPFTSNNVEYFAERVKAGTKEGWQIFKGGIMGQFGTPIKTTGTSNGDLQAPMIQAIQTYSTNQSINPPNRRDLKERASIASELEIASLPNDGTGLSSVISLGLSPSNTQQKTAGSDNPRVDTLDPRGNPLYSSGLYLEVV